MNNIEKFVSTMVEREIVKKDDKEIIIYGINTGVEIIINIVTTIILGSVFRLIFESIMFLISFSAIRIYAGGYHAKTALRCYFMSSATIAVILSIVKFTPIEYIVSISIILLLLSTATIIRYAPVETSNKPLDEKEQKHYHRKTIQNMVIEYCIILILFIVQQYRWAYVIILGIAITAILVIVQIKIKLRGESNG